MTSLDCLRVVLMVRRRREGAEERALEATAQEISRTRSDREKLHAELAKITTSRVQEIQSVELAMHHQSKDAWNRALQRRCSELTLKLQNLESQQAQQMAVYLAARHAREVAGELEEQSRTAYQADRAMREQKWNEDIFLARWISNSDKATSF